MSPPWRFPPLPEFLAPWPLAAVALMAVNDVYLKAAFHNGLTGKLSDVAGCFFLPLYVSALLRLATPLGARWRLGLGAGITAVLFVSVSLSPVAAAWVCRVVGGVGAQFGWTRYRIVSDPTDLVATPFILLAVWYGWRRTQEGKPCAS